MRVYGFKSQTPLFILTEGQACLWCLQFLVLNLLPKENKSVPYSFCCLLNTLATLKEKFMLCLSKARSIFLGLVSGTKANWHRMAGIYAVKILTLQNRVATCKLLPLNHAPWHLLAPKLCLGMSGRKLFSLRQNHSKICSDGSATWRIKIQSLGIFLGSNGSWESTVDCWSPA